MNMLTPSWSDFPSAQPLDPRSIIPYCSLGPTVGVFKRSTTFLQTTWGTNALAFTGNNTILSSLDNTDSKTIAYAYQWTFNHKMTNAGAAINAAITKIAFLKAGPFWDNQLEIALGATNYTDVQFSFRDNLGTAGSFLGGSTGQIPVISFAGTQTGNLILHLTILQPGNYSMVLVLNNAGTYSTFEMELVVLP